MRRYHSPDDRKESSAIALIGFGEAGQTLAEDPRGVGVTQLAARDIPFPDPSKGVRVAGSCADALRGAATLEEPGVEPLMTRGTIERQQRARDVVEEFVDRKRLGFRYPATGLIDGDFESA